MKIATIIGARPQFIKAAIVSRAIRLYQDEHPNRCIADFIVHTGQHHDSNMSQVFFDTLQIPTPRYNLGIDSVSDGVMTGRMLEAVEPILLAERPDCVLVYGDANTTLAGALAAAKVHIPVAHVEAGLRSGNRGMPEEINRIITDHISSKLFCPTETAVQNLQREGIEDGVYLVGDVMCDAVMYYGERASRESGVIERLALNDRQYVLATIHRAENTNNPQRLQGIANGLSELAREITVVLPMHPRTRRSLEDSRGCHLLDGVTIIDPVDYLDMLRLEQSARVVVTDSGGIQKEAFLYRVPCLTLRNETEWVETVDNGWNTLVGSDAEVLMAAYRDLGHKQRRERPNPYGDGCAAQRMLKHLLG